MVHPGDIKIALR